MSHENKVILDTLRKIACGRKPRDNSSVPMHRHEAQLLAREACDAIGVSYCIDDIKAMEKA